MVRSTRADYNLPNKTKTDLYIRIFNDSKLAQEIQALSDVLMSSAYASKVTIAETDDKIPEGCAIGKKEHALKLQFHEIFVTKIMNKLIYYY